MGSKIRGHALTVVVAIIVLGPLVYILYVLCAGVARNSAYWHRRRPVEISDSVSFGTGYWNKICGEGAGERQTAYIENRWVDRNQYVSGINSPTKMDMWVGITSNDGRVACAAKFELTVELRESVLEHYSPLPGYGEHRIITNVDSEHLVERLTTSQERPGFSSIMPGQCVFGSIDRDVDAQTDRYLIELPFGKRINVELAPHYSLENSGELTWEIKPYAPRVGSEELDDKTSPEWKKRQQRRIQHAVTFEGGLYEIAVSREALPRPAEGIEPDYSYRLMVTWGDSDGDGCFCAMEMPKNTRWVECGKLYGI